MLVSECMLLFANVHAVLCCAAMCCAVQYGAVWSGGAVSCWVVPRDTALPRCLAFFFWVVVCLPNIIHSCDIHHEKIKLSLPCDADVLCHVL